jgi:hypothetical protein
MRLGSQSFENERNVKFEARATHEFLCTLGHSFEMTFSALAEIPNTWECKTCGRDATLLVDGVPVEAMAADSKTPRSHWEMLLERRTLDELQVLLDEQLDNLRARRESARLAAMGH